MTVDLSRLRHDQYDGFVPKYDYQTYYNQANNSDHLRKLEQQVESLEEQSGQLLNFVHFLFQNFNELVKGTISAGTGTEKDLSEKIACLQSKEKDVCLTRREKDVFELLIKGMCAKEIARELFISETTVITHKKHLKEKFNARNTVELISKASASYAQSE
ncbi:MAG: helix-turn-helix transcriptional regulator [Gemmatimonadaceae bacterium]|nr:helix-turn-helix transcriptional regulator [Chitinophagaceae bacterium]